MIHRLISIFTMLLLALSAPAQVSLPPYPDARSIRGYAKTISGEPISYHSFHPWAREALLTRCTDGTSSIEWETDPLPENYADAYADFVWIGGFSCGTSHADREFSLYANGDFLLRYKTTAKKGSYHQSAENPEGARLEFDLKSTDVVDDMFGLFFLRLPAKNLPRGKAVRLKMVGEKAESPDWYMTFTYAMRESTVVLPRPALLNAPGGAAQVVDVMIDHSGAPATAKIRSPYGEDTIGLAAGLNSRELKIPPVRAKTRVPFEISIPGFAARIETVIVSPVEQREFWLLPHSHNDIGYSDLQTDVEKKQHKNIRDALALIRQTRGYPEGARFKWNVEILWAVESFLQTCTEEERREFLDAARAEEIGLQALYANNLTGIMRPEELIHLTDYARRLEKEQGLSIPSGMISDIPGMTWSSVSALAQGGVRWFSSGPNYMPGMPDLGDRVGNSNRAWMDKPFHWVGPSGRDTILYWMAGRGYSWFHNWIIGKAGADTRGPIFDYLRELDEKRYPYEMIQLRYTILGDNGPVDPGLPDFVKSWNERYLSPRFRIATSAEMFDEFEKRYGGMLPAYSGDMTPYWEDGAASTARDLGMNRKSADRLVQAGTLSAVLGQSTYAAAIARAWRNVLLFSEHTWGAHNSIGEPDGAFAREQWEIKRRFAVDADSMSRSILDGLTAGGAGETFDLFNTHSWPVSDLVILPAHRIGSGGRVREAGGKPLPSQRLRNGDLAFLASNVPAMGWKRYRIEPGECRPRDPVEVNPGELSGKNLRILLDQKSGAIGSLRVEGFRYDLAAAASNSGPSGLNALYRVAGLDPAAAVGDSLARMEIGETGPLVGSLLVESALPGCRSVRKEIRLVAGIDRVEIVNRIDKELIRTKESIHIAFPFFLPASNVRLDNGWGSVRPEAQQLPGACRDFFSVNGWVDCSNYAQGVAWLTDEAPLVELGSMVDERGKNRSAGAWKNAAVPSDTIYSYVMNNYWHTNYKADQPGEAAFRYAILPHGPFDEALVVRAGLEMREPLVAARAEPGRPASGSLFGLGAGQIVATSVQASADGKALMIRLTNASTGDASPRFAWKDFSPRTISESDATEQPIRPWNGSPIPAHAILTLRCEK